MPDLKKIKEKAEDSKCPIHGLPPVITIENEDLSLRACCEEFGIRIQKFIENEILYERFESIKKVAIADKYTDIISDSRVVYSSFDPTTSKLIEAGNLIFSKQFEEAKHILEVLLESISESDYSTKSSIHIHLMVIFFKLRNKSTDHLDLSNFHAKKAMIYGHNTGYATERLAINLEKQGRINQAIELCKLVIGPGYKFLRTGMGSKYLFGERLEKLQKKLSLAIDSPNEKLFTNEERDLIKRNSVS